MNYIWDFLIKAKDKNIKIEDIVFDIASSYSPYMELAFVDINKDKDKLEENMVVEINPYYRFYDIFKDFFSINFNESLEFRKCFFNILIHSLIYVDLRQGQSRKYYYKKFLMKDIESGYFSDEVKESIKYFNDEEKDIIVETLLDLYNLGTSLELFRNIVRKIFKKSIVYINKENKREVLFYLGEKYSKEKNFKVQLLTALFLDIKFEVLIYFESHVGILDVYETIIIDDMAIY